MTLSLCCSLQLPRRTCDITPSSYASTTPPSATTAHSCAQFCDTHPRALSNIVFLALVAVKHPALTVHGSSSIPRHALVTPQAPGSTPGPAPESRSLCPSFFSAHRHKPYQTAAIPATPTAASRQERKNARHSSGLQRSELRRTGAGHHPPTWRPARETHFPPPARPSSCPFTPVRVSDTATHRAHHTPDSTERRRSAYGLRKALDHPSQSTQPRRPLLPSLTPPRRPPRNDSPVAGVLQLRPTTVARRTSDHEPAAILVQHAKPKRVSPQQCRERDWAAEICEWPRSTAGRQRVWRKRDGLQGWRTVSQNQQYQPAVCS